MSKKLLIITSVILAVSFILSACGPAATAGPQTEIQTQVVVVTATPGPAGCHSAPGWIRPDHRCGGNLPVSALQPVVLRLRFCRFIS